MSVPQPFTELNVTNHSVATHNAISSSLPNIPLSLQISLGIIKTARVNMEIFNKQIRQKQRLLYVAYFRQCIQPQLQSLSIPQDLYDLCFHFFELDLVSLLHSDPVIHSKMSPSSISSPSTMTEKDCCLFARSLRDQKEYHIASTILEWLIAANPQSAHLHNAIATVFQRWSLYPEAENAYKRAIALEPSTNAFRYNLGLLLEKEEKYSDALAQFHSASAVDSKEAEYVFESAYCFQRLHDLDSATSLYLQAMQMRPDRAIYAEYYALYLCQEFDDLSAATTYCVAPKVHVHFDGLSCTDPLLIDPADSRCTSNQNVHGLFQCPGILRNRWSSSRAAGRFTIRTPAV